MSKINLLLTLLSLNAVLVIIERLSPTTKIILQPYSFLRVHEVFQMLVVIMLSIIISFYLLKHISRNFENLKTAYGTILGVLFVLGVYFTATGNGLHEVASFLFNTFCKSEHQSIACGSMFFDDYYFGNIVYFVGLLLGNVSLILFERLAPIKKTTRKQTIITVVNGLVYASTLIAYGAFDRVTVGMWFVAIAALFVDYLLFSKRTKYSFLPFNLYTAVGYSLSAVVIIFIRLR